jgi:glutathione S-transferase
MTLKIYGVAASRAVRTLWMAEELGLTYEHVPVHYMGGGAKTPEMLALNPNGHIPVIDDDGVVVWESLAINLYLARKHGGTLAAASLPEEAALLQWSFWAANECEKDALTILMHRQALPADQRDLTIAEKAAQRLRAPFAVLEGHLLQREYLLGERFTVADINVVSVLNWARPDTELMAEHTMVAAWIKRCISRDAFQIVKALARAPVPGV